MARAARSVGKRLRNTDSSSAMMRYWLSTYTEKFTLIPASAKAVRAFSQSSGVSAAAPGLRLNITVVTPDRSIFMHAYSVSRYISTDLRPQESAIQYSRWSSRLPFIRGLTPLP